MVRNYIKSVRLPGASKENLLNFAYPETEDQPNVINVICGMNNTGKSFLLERTRSILKAPWENGKPKSAHNVVVEMSLESGDQPTHLFFGKTWQKKHEVGLVSVRKKITQFPGDIPDYQMVIAKFLYRHVNVHLPTDQQVNLQEWLTSATVREQAIQQFKAEEEISKCQSDDPIVKKIEDILGAKLYFRRAKEANQVDFVLAYGDYSTSQYREWSDGQQMVFYIVALVSEINPDVVLLDEIENHLHPAYMTQVMGFLKEKVPQSFIATHHPHIIFSEMVDKVFYLEAIRPPASGDFPSKLSHQKQTFQRSPERRVYTLADGFNKVTAAYHLFDHQDRQLLKQATRIANDADVMFYHALVKIFSAEGVKTSDSILPDRQSRQVVEMLLALVGAKTSTERVKILDLGAGVGRTEGEISKLSQWQLGLSIDWICWHIEQKGREKLRQELNKRRIQAEVPDTLDQIENGSIDVSVIANVLHEIKPPEFAELLYDADKKTDPYNGVIVVLELYPLLSAEQFAVPYSPSRLIDIFEQVDLISTHNMIPVRDSTAYCIVARRKNQNIGLDKEVTRKAVEAAWEKIEKDALGSYAARRSVTNYEGYRAVIQDMTTIASVRAWKQGMWR